MAAPVTIMLHELGHFLVDKAFGFPEAVLHYDSATSGAAEANYPAWQQSVSAAAGPLVTISILLVCCYVVTRYGPNLVVMVIGLIVPIRMLVIGIAFILARLRGADISSGNFDELIASRGSGVPVDLIVAVELLALVAGWWYLVSRISRGERTIALLSCTGGMIIGILLWIGALGPSLLP